MPYLIPDEELVKDALLRVMSEKVVVESQAELLREVLKHLRRYNLEYTISGRRLRIIALKIPDIQVEIRCKVTRRVVEDMHTCPVCGGEMIKIENMTLSGGSVVTGFRCTSCPYWTGKKLRVPVRYIFRKV